MDEAGAISSGGLVPLSCTNGSVVALNPFVVGGVDETMVKGTPPWSPSWKLMVADEPTATLPKLREAGMVEIWAGGSADPLMAMPKFPRAVFIVATELNS
jgi:hypothetical protein